MDGEVTITDTEAEEEVGVGDSMSIGAAAIDSRGVKGVAGTNHRRNVMPAAGRAGLDPDEAVATIDAIRSDTTPQSGLAGPDVSDPPLRPPSIPVRPAQSSHKYQRRMSQTNSCLIARL